MPSSNVRSSADEHVQTSEGLNMATATPPTRRGPDAAEAALGVARVGRAAIRRQDPSSLRARRGRPLPWCGELTFRAPARHRAPDQQPGRTLIPGGGATGDQEALWTRLRTKPACPADSAMRRLRPVPSQRLPGAMVSGVPAVSRPAGRIDLDRHGQTRPG
jgi:hypothetical protein